MWLNCVNFTIVETIRVGPSAFLLAKACTQPIELCDFDGNRLLVEPGTSIQLPVFAIHHDERFYDEPNSFRPERFQTVPSNELKKSGRFLPFGDGQRQCIGKSNESNQFNCIPLNKPISFSGQKFANYQIKLALVEIVRHYMITVNSKTTEPLIATSLDSLLTPITDIYLDFQRIDEKMDWNTQIIDTLSWEARKRNVLTEFRRLFAIFVSRASIII